MKFEILHDFKIKTNDGIVELRQGQIIKIPKKSAQQLIEKGKVKPLPYLDRNGTLIIPFDALPKYRWWSCGQSVLDTLKELKADEQILKRYGYSQN